MQYEIYDDLERTLRRSCEEVGLDDATIERLVAVIVDAMRRAYGGQEIYFPRRRYRPEHMRDIVAARWTGRNTRELCRELEVSESRLRALAAEAAILRRDK